MQLLSTVLQKLYHLDPSSGETAVQEQDSDQRTDLKDEIHTLPSSPPAAHIPGEVLEAARRSHAGSICPAKPSCQGGHSAGGVLAHGMLSPHVHLAPAMVLPPRIFYQGQRHSHEGDHHPTGELTKARSKSTSTSLPLFLPAWSQFCSIISHQLL